MFSLFGVEKTADKTSNKLGRSGSGWRRFGSWPRWVTLAIAYFALLTTVGVIGGYSLNDASAANWAGPTANPPLGNIPLPVWNRLDTTQKQVNTAVDVDGYVAAGSPQLDLNPNGAIGGQNVIYGAAAYNGMYQESWDLAPKGLSDYLLLLETVAGNGVYTNRFRVDRGGNAFASGNIWAAGCIGPVFAGVTVNRYKGNQNGYFNANDKCGSLGGYLAGSHVCSTAEIMESIRCQTGISGIRSPSNNGRDAWIQDGPPGYVAPANDCQGWRSENTTDYGRIWRLSSDTGGVGFLTSCNQEIQFACCK